MNLWEIGHTMFKCCLKWLKHHGWNSNNTFYCFPMCTGPPAVSWRHITCCGQRHQLLWTEAMKGYVKFCDLPLPQETRRPLRWQRHRIWVIEMSHRGQMIKRVACISKRIWVSKKKFVILSHGYFVFIAAAKLSLFWLIEKHPPI